MDGFVKIIPEAVVANTSLSKIGGLDLPPGSYVVFAKATIVCAPSVIFAPGGALDFTCALSGGGAGDSFSSRYTDADCKLGKTVTVALTCGAQVLQKALVPEETGLVGPIEFLCNASIPQAIKIKNIIIAAIGVDSVKVI